MEDRTNNTVFVSVPHSACVKGADHRTCDTRAEQAARSLVDQYPQGRKKMLLNVELTDVQGYRTVVSQPYVNHSIVRSGPENDLNRETGSHHSWSVLLVECLRWMSIECKRKGIRGMVVDTHSFYSGGFGEENDDARVIILVKNTKLGYALSLKDHLVLAIDKAKEENNGPLEDWPKSKRCVKIVAASRENYIREKAVSFGLNSVLLEFREDKKVLSDVALDLLCREIGKWLVYYIQ